MDHKKRISILGCGWLGLPLANELVKENYPVKGSTTRAEKIPGLKHCHIDPFLVQLADGVNTDLLKDFFNSDVLIITIPPKKNPAGYLKEIEKIVAVLPKTPVKEVVYISSTSVYGNTNRRYNENDPASPETESGKAMAVAEKLLIEHPSFKTAVVRFGGLTGPERSPGRFLAGKTDVPNGLAPINLIHLNDCIGIIKAILEKTGFGHIYNACSPDHPSRKDFYTLSCRMENLPEPAFVEERGAWKIIDSSNVPSILKYDFQIKDWLGWLRSGQL